MKGHRETSVLAVVALTLAVAAIFGANVISAEKTTGGRQRSFAFTYEVRVPANPESKGETRLYMPLPQSDEHQSDHSGILSHAAIRSDQARIRSGSEGHERRSARRKRRG